MNYNKFQFRTDETMEQEINTIIENLTITEKIRLLSGDNDGRSTYAIEEKGIPQFKMADGPIGVHWWTEKSTTYPSLIAVASTWDVDLVEKMGLALGSNAKQRGIQILLAPGVNIYRSPLCGRNFEYFGEDPYLSSQMAKAYIIGVQKVGVCATVKHYALNFQEYNRHNVSSDVDERTLHEIYLPAFKTAVTEAQVGAVMTAYNLVNGVHCSEHKELIHDILKTKWKFKGLVMSDWVSVYSDVKAAQAGLDLEMPTGEWFNEEKLLPLIRQGQLSEEVIDDKIRRLLRIAFQFGWMRKDKRTILDDEETSQISYEVASSGVVLLKNNESILPLNINKIKKIAIIGPNAHPTVLSGGGSAFNPPLYEISIVDGIKKFLQGRTVEIEYEKGIVLSRELDIADSAQYFIEDNQQGLKAEYFNNDNCSGEPVLIRNDSAINFHWENTPPVEQITTDFYSVRWTGKIKIEKSGEYRFYVKSGDSRYKIWLDDAVIIDNWSTEEGGLKITDKILEKKKTYSLKIEYAKTRVWASIIFGYEKRENVENDLQKAYEVAEKSDVVILSVGFNEQYESEGFDRTFALPENQSAFINAIAKKNPNTIVLLSAGGGVEMESWIDSVKAVLHTWYLGQNVGKAVADILFGKVTPSGKLPISIERRLEDNSSFFTYHDKGDLHVALTEGIFTGYRHFDKNKIDPLFPFGYGLSYTAFQYSEFQLSKKSISENEKLKLSFVLKNIGEYDGAEIVQMYISDLESSLVRPLKELKNFQKIFLKKGEEKKCFFEISLKELKFYNPEMHSWVYEEGEFAVHIGRSSKDIVFTETFILKSE